MTIALIKPEPAPVIDESAVQEAELEGSAIETQATNIVIETTADHALACDLERDWSTKEKRAAALVEPARDASHKAWKANVNIYDQLVGPYERARKTIKAKIGAWREAERKRNEAEAERLRKLAERQVEDEALARAARAEAAGRPKEADALLRIMPAAPVVVAASPPESLGVSTRKNWTAEVYDIDALIRWVAENPAHRRQYLAAAMPALNQQAKAMKECMNSDPEPIPGVRAISKWC